MSLDNTLRRFEGGVSCFDEEWRSSILCSWLSVSRDVFVLCLLVFHGQR